MLAAGRSSGSPASWTPTAAACERCRISANGTVPARCSCACRRGGPGHHGRGRRRLVRVLPRGHGRDDRAHQQHQYARQGFRFLAVASDAWPGTGATGIPPASSTTQSSASKSKFTSHARNLNKTAHHVLLRLSQHASPRVKALALNGRGIGPLSPPGSSTAPRYRRDGSTSCPGLEHENELPARRALVHPTPWSPLQNARRSMRGRAAWSRPLLERSPAASAGAAPSPRNCASPRRTGGPARPDR